MARAFSISHPETSLSARRICGTSSGIEYPWIFIFFIYIYILRHIHKYISRREVRFNSKTYGASSISLLSLLGNINIISIYPEKRNIIEIELY